MWPFRRRPKEERQVPTVTYFGTTPADYEHYVSLSAEQYVIALDKHGDQSMEARLALRNIRVGLDLLNTERQRHLAACQAFYMKHSVQADATVD